jgi:hypothetical protein
MMEHRPNKSIKVLVLEGSLRLSVNGRLGESLTLRPGQMVMMPANGKRIPAPVDIDLARVMKTSSLVNMSGGAAALPSAALIRQSIAAQEKAKDDRTLATTNLVVNGAGTDVRVISEPMIQSISRRNDPAMPTSSVPPTFSDTPAPTAPTAPGTTNPPTNGGSSTGGNTGNGNGNNGNNGNHGNGNNGNGNGNTGNGNGPGGNGNGNNGDNGNHGNGNSGNGNGNNGNGNGPGGTGNGPTGDGATILPVTSTDDVVDLLEHAVLVKSGSVIVGAPKRSNANGGPNFTPAASRTRLTDPDAVMLRDYSGNNGREPRSNPPH